MSDTPKKNSAIVVLSVPVNQNLMRRNRWLVATVFVLMSVIVLTGFLLLPSNDFLANYQRVTANDIATAELNPVLSAEVNTLKGQVVGLVSGSIESKLRSLEASVRSGTLSNSLGTIEDLKNDLKVLRSYSEPPKKETTAAAINTQLIQEMAQLKRLIYLTLASCGLMLAVIAGVWLKQKQLPYNAVIKKIKSMV